MHIIPSLTITWNGRGHHDFLFQVASSTELVTWLSGYFYVYYPIMILLVSIGTLFSCGSRMASYCNYNNLLEGDELDDYDEDTLDDGKDLIQRGNVCYCLLLEQA